MVGNLEIQSIPEGAKVYLDGTDTLKITPSLFILEAGFHAYKLSLSGHNDVNGQIYVTDGEKTTLIVSMSPIFYDQIIKLGMMGLVISIMALIFRK